MNIQDNPICIGTGLVALDVVVTGSAMKDAQFLAGGSCGNVLTILSYLGWNSYPISRLSNNVATELLIEDLHRWNVNDDLLTATEDGSTPVIIHRIMTDKLGDAKHRFEFRNPEDGKHLPAYKPVLAKDVPLVLKKSKFPNVFYFDRMNRSAIDLAKFYKANGTVVFFEPSNSKDIKAFNECLTIADVVKFSDDRIYDYEKQFPKAIAGLEIQTLGKSGLKYRVKGEIEWRNVDGYNVDKVVDAAGAGDWCTAGIIYSLFKDKKVEECSEKDIEHAFRFGQALSALNCTFEGARGLMYFIKKSELLIYIRHLVENNVTSIATKKSLNNIRQKSPDLTIGSLFTKV